MNHWLHDLIERLSKLLIIDLRKTGKIFPTICAIDRADNLNIFCVRELLDADFSLETLKQQVSQIEIVRYAVGYESHSRSEVLISAADNLGNQLSASRQLLRNGGIPTMGELKYSNKSFVGMPITGLLQIEKSAWPQNAKS